MASNKSIRRASRDVTGGASTSPTVIMRALALVMLCVSATGCVIHNDADNESASRMFGSNYFGAGGELNLTEPVAGDAFMAGGNIATAGEVAGDLFAAGGDVSIGGSVGDDLYVAGGDVQVDAIVTGNARVLGGDVALGPATVVAGALSLTGGRVVFDGNTHGNLQASGASVRVNGTVHGDAEVSAESVEIGPDTRIAGRLIVHSASEPVVPEGAEIVGGVEYHVADPRKWMRDDGVGHGVRSAVHGVGSFLWILGVFVVGTLFTWILPGYSSRAAAFIGNQPLKALGLGFVTLVCLPVLIVFLLVIIIGIPLALILMPFYFALMFMGWITVALFLGRKGLALTRPSQADAKWPPRIAFLLAIVVLWLLGQVPVVGGWVKFIALLLGMGALVWQAGSRRASSLPIGTT